MYKKILNRLLPGVVLLLFFTMTAVAKDGYKIQLKITDVKDTMVYLAHYYGKPLPTIYKTDSVRLDKNGAGTMQGKSKLIGGIYMILLSDKKTFFDILLNNGDDIGITTSLAGLPTGIKFTGSPENERFLEYGKFLSGFGDNQYRLSKKLSAAKTAEDSAKITKEINDAGKELTTYRKNYVAKYPKSILANVFEALIVPEVPQEKHLTPNGKTDNEFAFRYYRNHYWDKFDFTDERLVNAPIYDAKLDEYINKLTYQHEDSVIKESKYLLAKSKNSPELYKYTLWWLTYNAQNSKIMGMDAVYVYLVENYYMKGEATWLSHDDLQKYYDAAQKIAPNVLGNIAPELKMPDVNGKIQSLREMKAKYTLLVFWSPDCGHCMQEMPIVDSLYRAVLKSKGVKIYAVSTYDDEKMWKDFIQKHKLQDWTHVWDPEHKTRFREDYNVYMTPIMYLLDDKKIIRGKRLDYVNIAGLIDVLDKRQKSESSK